MGTQGLLVRDPLEGAPTPTFPSYVLASTFVRKASAAAKIGGSVPFGAPFECRHFLPGIDPRK